VTDVTRVVDGRDSGFPVRGFHPLRRDLPVASMSFVTSWWHTAPPVDSHDPEHATPVRLHVLGLGSLPFARRYLGGLIRFPFLQVLRWFNSLGWLPSLLYIQRVVTVLQTAGFPHSDTPGSSACCRLPEAFRRLPRPSSPLAGKASPVCPLYLDRINPHAPFQEPLVDFGPDTGSPTFCRRLLRMSSFSLSL